MEPNEISIFLQKVYPFSNLSDDARSKISDDFRSASYSDGDVLFKEDTDGDSFCIIVSGAIKLSRNGEALGTVGSMEYTGESSLLSGKKRSATAESIGNSVVLEMTKESFKSLLSKYPQVGNHLKLATKSYEIALRRDFSWLSEDEVVRLIDQKHWLVLLGKLALLIFVSVFLLVVSYFTTFYILLVAAFLIVPWLAWIWVDWGNDYYIVTNKRVVWLEKVVWFYDQRREAPLQTILSVNSSTNYLQRMVGYANVIIKTYTGQITMRNTANPNELEGMIKAYWHLASERTEEAESAKLAETIRTRLDFKYDEPKDAADGSASEGGDSDVKAVSILPPGLGNLFKTRYEFEGTITYRKHLFILIQQIWVHISILAIILFAILFRAFNILTFPSLTILSSTFGIYLLISSPFVIYRLVDWANDRYQLTDKEIVDLDKKPLGKENKRSAPLENILSLDYTRANILQRALNFGTVAINVGNAQFDFEMVVDPSMVQQEVFEYYYAAIQRKENAEAQRRRDDMVDFLEAYHKENERYQQYQASKNAAGSAGVEILWQEDLSRWIALLPEGSVLTLFGNVKDGSREPQIKAILNVNQQQLPLGSLEAKFYNSPLQVLLLDIYNTYFIVGRVDDSVEGNLVSVSMRREEGYGETDKSVKTSVIKNRIFFIPISVDEREQWDSITWIGIKTVESSMDNLKSGYIWESEFYLPIQLEFSHIE